MEDFGTKFKNELQESSFNEYLMEFCKTVKAVSVKKNDPFFITQLLKDIQEEIEDFYTR